ncbi:MAG: hypothetical protein MI824_14675 [Hyphomicrobiales bacterium]|nr:hypothetical protein [Hyphomicrobiales bacterium]
MTANKTRLGSGDFARRIRFEQSGNISATDVQEAIEELDTEKQGLDATLTSIAGLGTAANKYMFADGVDSWVEGDITAAGRALLDDADAAAQRATLGLVIGTDVQAFDATLASLAGLGTAADRFAYTTALDTWTEATITAAGRALLEDASAADQRVTLGVQIGVDVQAFDAQLADLAGLTPTKGNVVVGDGSNFISLGVGSDDQVLTADAAQVSGIRWATPASGQDASTTQKGIVELATDAETQTGTDATRAITPAKLTAKEATTAQFRNNTADRILTTDQVWSSASLVTLTDTGTIAVNMSAGINFQVTLAGNRTLGNPTNVKAGQSGLIIVNQDGTGGRTLAYGANWEFPGGAAPTLTTTANAKDILTYFVQNSSRIIVTGILKDVS